MVEIFNLQVPQKLLSLFVECDMCNILQHQVALVLSFVLQKTEADLNFCQKLWIVECQLFPWFVDAWELNFVSVSTSLVTWRHRGIIFFGFRNNNIIGEKDIWVTSFH
jgi:hypothetical protein